MPDNDAVVEFIRGFFVFALGIGTTYLTVAYKAHRGKRKISPEDRETFLFDRYEKALAQVDEDLEVARKISNDQSVQIEKMQGTIDTLRNELNMAQQENRKLQLANINLAKSYKPEAKGVE